MGANAPAAGAYSRYAAGQFARSLYQMRRSLATFTVSGVGANRRIRMYAAAAPNQPASAGSFGVNLSGGPIAGSQWAGPLYNITTPLTGNPITLQRLRAGNASASITSSQSSRVNIANNTLSLNAVGLSGGAQVNKVVYRLNNNQEAAHIRFKVRFTNPNGQGTFYAVLGDQLIAANDLSGENNNNVNLNQDNDLAAVAFSVNGSQLNVSYTNGGGLQSLTAMPNISFDQDYFIEIYAFAGQNNTGETLIFSRGANQYQLQSNANNVGQWTMFMGTTAANMTQVIPPTPLNESSNDAQCSRSFCFCRRKRRGDTRRPPPPYRFHHEPARYFL
jgi:hypothetical protein